MKTYRVIQYGAGHTGKFALRSILTQPQLELVALGVHGPAKEGMDAGDICRLPATGVYATRNISRLLAQDADCVCFMAADPHVSDAAEPGSHAAGLLDLICAFLASGKNVIATSPNSFVHAPYLGGPVVDRLNRACAKGNASFHYVGVSPGFMPDRLILNLTAISSRIELITVQEMMNYGDYDDREMLFELYGFGSDPASFDAAHLSASFGRSLGGSVAMIADGLAADLDEVKTEIEFAASDRDFGIRTGTIPKGSIGAERIRVSGMIGGKPRIIVEHITRVGDHVAPDWPRFGAGNAEGYRIAIQGAPSMSVDVELGAFGRNPMADAGWAVGGHITNSIPNLCDAPPGIRTFIDLPATMGRHRMSG
jgi:hypothetical protein